MLSQSDLTIVPLAFQALDRWSYFGLSQPDFFADPRAIAPCRRPYDKVSVRAGLGKLSDEV